MPSKTGISVVIPARSEAESLRAILPRLADLLSDAEIIVVDDGSADDTPAVCALSNIRCLQHHYPMGNGAAIKTGARAALGDMIVFMDADGQHQPEDIPVLLEKFAEGYDMVVGARQSGSHAGPHRALANDVFSRLASWMVTQNIEDLTSGFRVVRASKFRQFLYLLPNGFSYPTTITMSFFRAGYGVAYVPIHTPRRVGKSHIRPLRDGVRFLLIIIKIGTLYSPQKLFLPISAGFFLTGLGWYFYTFLSTGRFTNMSALLFIAAIFTFLIGIVSEQISALHFKDLNTENNSDSLSEKD
jgi:glycosyltransferase involved in cell wall biosynthesis